MICIDDLIDLQSLRDLHPKMCESIALCYEQGKVEVQGNGNLIKDRYPYDTIINKHNNTKFPDSIKTPSAKLRYTSFLVPSIGIASVIPILNNHMEFKVENDNDKMFSFLIDWIKSQDIYEELIMCNVVVSLNGEPTPIHDHNTPIHDNITNVNKYTPIWMRVTLDRQLFMFDENTKEKHYLKKDGYMFVWDPRKNHGADTTWNSTYSIQMRGKASNKLSEILNNI